MARRSLRPQLNQIRSWVQQGRTDAWIAHQLEVTVQQIEAFKRENELAPGEAEGNGPTADFDDEIDLRAQDDELIAAELERAEAERVAKEAAEAERRAADGDDEDEDEDAEAKPAARRRRLGHRPVVVTIEEDQIVIRRAGEDGDSGEDDED
jgi:hypothetical protein